MQGIMAHSRSLCRTAQPHGTAGGTALRSTAQQPLARSGQRAARPQRTRQAARPCCCEAAERPLPGGAAADADAAARAGEAARADELAAYEQLKADMNRTTRNFAGFVTGYILLTSTSDVAACAAMGALAGYGYLQLLMRDVDAFRQDDPVAAAFLMQDDSRLELAALRSVKRIGAAYRAALRPRLLVLVGLAAAATAYNAVATEPLNGLQAGALFGGFLTYKAGQIGQVWDATRPKFDAEALKQPPRPTLANVDEEELEDVSEEEWRERLKGKPY